MRGGWEEYKAIQVSRFQILLRLPFFLKGREILMRMLEVFVRKFHSIAMHELPVIMEKW